MSDVSKTSDELEKLALAAEDAAGGPPSAEQVDALIAYADALRAALEAAARVPVQGEPPALTFDEARKMACVLSARGEFADGITVESIWARGAVWGALGGDRRAYVAVQGEPNDDREAVTGNELADAVHAYYEASGKPANSEGVRAVLLLSRATVPDAATELAEIKARAEEVGEDEGWHIGGAWGDYGEVVVPLRILSYVVDGALDEKIVSTDPGYAATYAEQVARADHAEADRDAALAAIERVTAERDAAMARIAKAWELHEPFTWSFGHGPVQSCKWCADHGVSQEVASWPCPTVAALDGAPEQHEHESVAPQPSESDVRERLVEAALETVDWDAIDAGEASPREAAGHAVWKALAALDGAPEPEVAEAETGVRPWADRFRYAGSDAGNGVLARGFERAKAERERQARLDVLRGQSTDEIVNGLQLPVEGEGKS